VTTTGALADEHKLEPYYSDGSRRPAGLAWSHRLPDGRWCQADIPLRGDRRGGWIVILDEPLTVTPALRCGCGRKAWLTGGKVRPA
jgi:hypothetical protein